MTVAVAATALLPHRCCSYKHDGWQGWGHWLGNGNLRSMGKIFQGFESALAVARSLGMKNRSDWQAWSKSGARPVDMPSAPNRTYKGRGWQGWAHWLGTTRRAVAVAQPSTAAAGQQPKQEQGEQLQRQRFRWQGAGVAAEGWAAAVPSANHREASLATAPVFQGSTWPAHVDVAKSEGAHHQQQQPDYLATPAYVVLKMSGDVFWVGGYSFFFCS